MKIKSWQKVDYVSFKTITKVKSKLKLDLCYQTIVVYQLHRTRTLASFSNRNWSLSCPLFFSLLNLENLLIKFWQSSYHWSLKINNLEIHCKLLHSYSYSPWKPYAQGSEQFHCSSHFHTCFQHQSKVQPHWGKKKKSFYQLTMQLCCSCVRTTLRFSRPIFKFFFP